MWSQSLSRQCCCFLGLQVSVPQHRLTPLKTAWLSLYQPITDNLKLDMRMNLKTRKVGCTAPDTSLPLPLSPRRARNQRAEAGCPAQVEIKTTPKTADAGHLQKAADFVHAYILGACHACPA